MPLPSDETTPPVMKMNRGLLGASGTMHSPECVEVAEAGGALHERVDRPELTIGGDEDEQGRGDREPGGVQREREPRPGDGPDDVGPAVAEHRTFAQVVGAGDEDWGDPQ